MRKALECDPRKADPTQCSKWQNVQDFDLGSATIHATVAPAKTRDDTSNALQTTIFGFRLLATNR